MDYPPSFYPITLSFRDPQLEAAYYRFRVARTLSLGDEVFVGVRLAIILTYFAVVKELPTVKYAAIDAASLLLQAAIIRSLPQDRYIAHRDHILLAFRLLYFLTAALGIPHHLTSLPLTDTPATAFRIAFLGSGAINNALLGLGMPQMLKLFHLVQAACCLAMAAVVNTATCRVLLDLPSGPRFVHRAWHTASAKLQLVSSYWVGLPALDLQHVRRPSPHRQCAMLLALLHFWLGFVFPSTVWYLLERHSRQCFLRIHAPADPDAELLQQQLEMPWCLMLLLWLLVALLVFCALWDVMHTFA